jgi:hypothetical protein
VRAGSDSSAPDSTQQQWEQRRAALVTMLLAAFALSAEVVKRLAQGIYAARVAAYTSAYTAAAYAAGETPPDDWRPSDAALTALATAAFTAAQQIAATYRDDLERAAADAVDAWLTKHPGADMTGPVERDLAHEVKAWADARADWKAQQVGQYETASAAQQATADAASDLTDGTLTGADGLPLDMESLQVAVLPAESSPDECADIGGQVFAFDDAPSLDLPAHPFCVHYWVIIGPDGSEMDL